MWRWGHSGSPGGCNAHSLGDGCPLCGQSNNVSGGAEYAVGTSSWPDFSRTTGTGNSSSNRGTSAPSPVSVMVQVHYWLAMLYVLEDKCLDLTGLENVLSHFPQLNHLSPVLQGTAQAWVMGSHFLCWVKLRLHPLCGRISVGPKYGDMQRFLTPRAVRIWTVSPFSRWHEP
jgi:hypothetical protein